ncbi:hypothetical protein BGZ74_010151, partial [Mortierella antarctica]
MEEEGDSFVRLFDILQRRNDKDKKLINRWITELPASSTDRKAKLGLEQPWLQSHKQAYLLDPEARKNLKEECETLEPLFPDLGNLFFEDCGEYGYVSAKVFFLQLREAPALTSLRVHGMSRPASARATTIIKKHELKLRSMTFG